MAVKIIETKTGEVIKTSKQVKRDRTIRKVQKYLSVFAVVMLMLIVSGVTVFATGGTGATPATNTTPAGVDTSTMSQFGTIIWWIVRIVILAVGGVPGIIKVVQGISDEDNRGRNAGIVTLIATGAGFGATFALQQIINHYQQLKSLRIDIQKHSAIFVNYTT